MSMMMMMLPVDEIAEVFHEVIPIPQEDGDDPVCSIDYPTSFRMAYEYMRACLKNGEKSYRSLKLSATCLRLNPANYTLWHYRRACMDALGYFDSPSVAKSKIQDDLTLASQLGGSNPKNYQVWYHRRALLEAFHTLTSVQSTAATTTTTTMETLGSEFLQSELGYLSNVLAMDSKNYHAWSHRQWLIRTVNIPEIWDQEIEFTARLIQMDPRNNSAWNERWFAIHKSLRDPPLSLDVCQSEAEYAIIKGAALDPYNESPFRYLIGLLNEQKSNHSTTGTTSSNTCKMLATEWYPKVQALDQVLIDAQRVPPEACTNWTSALIDLLECMGDSVSVTRAISFAQDLATQYDTIRRKYWELRIRQLQKQLASVSE